MDIEESLKRVLEDQISAINGMEDGSEEKTAAVKEFEIMNRAYLDQIETENANMQKYNELKLAEQEAARDNRDRIIGHIIGGCKIVGVAALIIGSSALGYKFEETGTQTSQTFKHIQDWIWKFTKI